MSVLVKAFGKQYPIPEENVSLSAVLAQMFSGRYKERNEVELNLDPELAAAWNVVYSELIQPGSSTLQGLSSDTVWDVFQLVEYLGVDYVFVEVADAFRQGIVPERELLQAYPRYSFYPELVDAAAEFIIRNHQQWNELPEWVRRVFEKYKTISPSELPSRGLFLARVRPLDYTNLYLNRAALNELWGPGYSRVCQSTKQPRGLTLSGVHQLGRTQIINTFEGQYLTCPPNYPFAELKNDPVTGQDVPCCTIRRNANVIPRVNVDYNVLGNRTGMIAEGGFLVFVPQGFQGDYVISDQYRLMSDLNAVVL